MKSKAQFLTLLILLVFSNLYTLNKESFGQVKQQLRIRQEWVARYNGPANGHDHAKSVKLDNSGNIFVSGESYGSGSGYDFAIVKYNPAGILQWVQRYNGPGNGNDYVGSIAVDGAGNVFVTGWSRSIRADDDIATIKYNSSGVLQWISRYNSPDSLDDLAYSITIDGAGNVYVTGQTFLDYITIKYNASGVQQWVQTYDGPGVYVDESYSIVSDVSGNTYVTGFSFGMNNFDYATLKYNSSGVRQWVSRYNGPGNVTDNARSAIIDAAGNVYVTGHSLGIGTGYDYATIKYNPSGIQQWVSRYNGPGNDNDNGYSIAADNHGNIFVTGHSRNGSALGTEDYATIKYNSFGVQQWIARYNGPGNGFDSAYSIAVDGSGNVFVTGGSIGSATLLDYATIKYNSNGVQQWVQRYNGPGNSDDRARSIAVNNSGNIYITGASAGNGTGLDYATIKYSGLIEPPIITGEDMNQNGSADLSDIISTYIDSKNFVAGYVQTDLNKDNSVNLSDIIIAYNNSIR